jgi:NAD(P)-dependent dehydrogenase (short-subunit alcohol dehydrogenase family)
MKIEGCGAIVTGGASGLGAATAEALAKAGAKVALFDLNIDLARATAAKIGALALKTDVADPASVTDAIAEAQAKNGGTRILVNCAGIGPPKRIVGRDGPMPLEEFEKVIKVNLIGTFNMIRLVGAQMQTLPPLDDNERGVFVSTASVAAYEGQIGQSAYSASKGGIVALNIVVAREFAQFGIRSMTIAPGIFRTPLLGGLGQAAQDSLDASVPFPKRMGHAAEYAALVLHCVSNSYLNGETIRIDGALRMAPR